MKQFPALIAAIVITGIIAFAMFSVGTNALANQNTVPLLNSPTQATTGAQVGAAQASTQDQSQQMQSLIQQYQQQNQQMQSELNNAIQQINQDNTQIQQYQQLLMALQQEGLIIIRNDGTILIPRG